MRVVKSQLTYCLESLSVMADRARGMRLTDIAGSIEAPKSSTQRLLDHLSGEGWVEQDEETGRYRLTMRLAVLGQRYLQSAGIADAAQGILDRIARRTQELVRLTVLDGDRLHWIGSAQGALPGLRYEPSMSSPIICYATANGKAWLATLDDERAKTAAFADGLGRSAVETGLRSMRAPAALLADLGRVRRRGYAIAQEEAERGVAAVAVAIRDSRGATLGTLSVAGPIVRVTPDRFEDLARELKTGAEGLSLAWPTRSAGAGRAGARSVTSPKRRGSR